MRIHEVCQATGLTKKAINWYEEQGLIAVPTDENGYRDFQDADIQKLKEIGLLRSLGLSAKEIETVLRASDKPAALKTIQAQKQRALEAQQFQVELLGKLSQNYTPDAIEQLRQEWNSAPIGQKLQSAFPGFFGRVLFQHFLPYLQEPIRTEEQQNAYQTILTFLDGLELQIPLAIRIADRLWGEAYDRLAFDPNAGINRLLNASEAELEAFKKTVLQEARKRRKWTARLNPFLRAHQTLRRRLAEAGYYDVFLPKLRILSATYAEYMDRLQALNCTVCEEQGIHMDERGRITIEE